MMQSCHEAADMTPVDRSGSRERHISRASPAPNTLEEWAKTTAKTRVEERRLKKSTGDQREVNKVREVVLGRELIVNLSLT